MYEAYTLFASPWFSPRVDLTADQKEPDQGPAPPKPPENRRQAELYLSESKQAWADSKYQFRSDSGFFYFDEWNRVEPSDRQVRFKPFAMIWRPKGHPPDKAPYTIVSDSALVEFASKFELTKSNPGRVVGGALEGKVQIRGPDNLAIDGQYFNFAEQALRIWSEHVVHFQQGPHKGHGHGLDLDLIPSPEAKDDEKPAVSGIKTVRLRKDVQMILVSESKSPGKPAEQEKVFVDSDGSFNYDVDARLASFEKNVRVNRPTGKGQSDRLNCHLLTLFFETKAAIAGAAAAEARQETPPKSDAAPPSENDSKFGNLDFRRLRAEGPVVTVSSQRSEMQGRMNELTYDAKDRVIVLRDAKQVSLLQKNNELLCPEITAGLDDKSQIERATCRGAGQLFNYGTDTDSNRIHDNKPIEMAAKWQKKLNKSFDPTTGLDLIEFEGRAELRQADKSTLAAETIRIWITPDQKLDARGGGDGSGAQESKIQPKKLLAVHEVEFASSQIRGQTERLEIWFEEGGLPSPPVARAGRPTPQVVPPREVPILSKGREKFPAKRGLFEITGGQRGDSGRNSGESTSRQAFAAIDDDPSNRGPASGRSSTSVSNGKTTGKPAGKSRVKQPEKAASKSVAKPAEQPRAKPAEKEPENPLVVKADWIRVRAMRDGDETKIAEVDTEGHVHIVQEHPLGELPLDLTGDRLYLKNYAGSSDNQIVDVTGRPARVQDRKMQIEGPKIHFDRITNNASVIGPGVLRVPVPNGMDGKPLEVPQLLDVFWKEKMEFDGKVAHFFAGVHSKLDGSDLHCEEMHVTFNRRISFAEDASPRDTPRRDAPARGAKADGAKAHGAKALGSKDSEPAEIHLVVCRDNVDLKSYEYENNRLIGVRTAQAFEFTLDHSSGRITSQGPGTLELWRRGNGKSAGLGKTAAVDANKARTAESAEWEYTRINFKGRMDGNTNDRTTTFRDRVLVVYGPVTTSTQVIDENDEDKMSKDGGWMSCQELTLTQIAATKTQLAYVTMRAFGEAILHGRSFHAVAHVVTYDERKGLYVLTGDGKRNATIWHEKVPGATARSTSAQGIEFIPAENNVRITEAAYGQGSK